MTKIIQQVFVSTQHHVFFDRIGCELPIRRAYRLWLSEKLYSDANSLSAFVSYVMGTSNNYWKEETLIAVMLSPYASSFFDTYSDLLFENDHALLLQVTKIILLACRDFNNKFEFENILTQHSGLQYYFTSPLGNGWEAIISFLYKNRALFSYEEITPFLPLLKDWCNYQANGEATRHAAFFALSFYPKYQTLEHRYIRKDNQDLLLHIMTSGTAEIKNELSTVTVARMVRGRVETALTRAEERYRSYFSALRERLERRGENRCRSETRHGTAFELGTVFRPVQEILRCTPYGDLLEMRLNYARSLLIATSFSMKEIAVEYGWSDEHYFSRIFRRKIGMTPTVFRAGCR